MDIAPFPPQGETPREFIKRITGKEHEWIPDTWEEVKGRLADQIYLTVQGSDIPVLLTEAANPHFVKQVRR